MTFEWPPHSSDEINRALAEEREAGVREVRRNIPSLVFYFGSLASVMAIGCCSESKTHTKDPERKVSLETTSKSYDRPLADSWLSHHHDSSLSYQVVRDRQVVVKNMLVKGGKSFSGLRYDNFSIDDLFDTAQTNCYTSERVRDVFDGLNNTKSCSKDSDLVSLAFSNTKSVLRDDFSKSAITKVFGGDFDCKAESATLAANYLRLLEDRGLEGDVSLVTGIYFGSLAPEGEGHSWNVVNGRIVDCALKKTYSSGISSSEEAYVPLVTTTFHLSGKNISTTLTANCLPEGYKEKER